MAGAHTVVDVSNSPSFDDEPVMHFFTTSTRNLLAAERVAGVRHHVALSIVGADRTQESGYMRAKCAQEKLIEESGSPYSIVRATQFFEFIGGIADSATDGNTVRLSNGAFQPIASAARSTDSVQLPSAGASPRTISSPLVARLRNRMLNPSKPNSRAAASICDSTAQLICGVPKPRNAQLGVVCDNTARAWILALGVR